MKEMGRLKLKEWNEEDCICIIKKINSDWKLLSLWDS